MCIFVIYIEFFPYCLFVSNSQVIGCEDCLRNDPYCVGWGVKLCLIQSQYVAATFITCRDVIMTLYSVHSNESTVVLAVSTEQFIGSHDNASSAKVNCGHFKRSQFAPFNNVCCSEYCKLIGF